MINECTRYTRVETRVLSFCEKRPPNVDKKIIKKKKHNIISGN